MDGARFDNLTRSFRSMADRRTTLRAIVAAAAAAGAGLVANRAEARCIAPGDPCRSSTSCCSGKCHKKKGKKRGTCADCKTGQVFCQFGRINACVTGPCCPNVSCTGKTCCPPNQTCATNRVTSECLCNSTVGPKCGRRCCKVGQACVDRHCGDCPAGADICAQSPTSCGNSGYVCATSVEQTTACIHNSSPDFQCANCTADGDCAKLLNKPAICVSGSCLGGACPQSKACFVVATPQ